MVGSIYRDAARYLIATVLCVAMASCGRVDESLVTGASGMALLEKVELGDNRGVAILLAEGAYTEVRNEKGYTPLLLAVKMGNLEVARMLLNHDVDWKARSGKGKGPVELAMDSGNEEMVRCLIRGGVDLNEIGSDGNPLLLKAVTLDDEETVRFLLAEKASPDAAGKDGRTPLHVAVEHGLFSCAKILLEQGADVNVVDDAGVSPLWLASAVDDEVERQACIKLLLDSGADVNLPGPGKRRLLGRFVSMERFDEVLVLLDHGACVGANTRFDRVLDELVVKRDWGMLDMLLSRGVDGSVLLAGALGQGNVVLLQMLQEHGVHFADTALTDCVRASNEVSAGWLLSKGWSADARLTEGQRLLHLAVSKRDGAMARILLEHGADPNRIFARPVSKAFLSTVEKESTRWFLRNDRRVTPLMVAANHGDVGMIASLLEHGARKYVYTGRHRLYPLNFASRRSDVKSMQMILGQDYRNEKMYAVLDLSEQRVRLFDMKGEVLFNSRVSTGKRGYRTPTGTFVITDKHRSHTSTIYGSKMPYFQRLSCSAFGFHSGYCPGYPASHGCIRMPYRAAKRFFAITPLGTRVVIKP